MGQYYKPTILGTNRRTIKGYWYSHKTGNGLKLMEHSYITNSLCNCVENYLRDNQGANLVWAGDYADPEKVRYTKDEAKEIWKNLVVEGKLTCSFNTFWKSSNPALYKPESDNDENIYSLCNDREDDNGKVIRKGKPELPYNTASDDDIRYIVNETKKEYVDLWNVPSIGGQRIHPLPLLTCEGNGRGGGDYYGINEKYVGRWSRDFIRVCNYHEREFLKDLGYVEIKPMFAEMYNIRTSLRDIAELVEIAYKDGYDINDTATFADIRVSIERIKTALPKKTAKENADLEKYRKTYMKQNA